jgi:hypothetical protein
MSANEQVNGLHPDFSNAEVEAPDLDEDRVLTADELEEFTAAYRAAGKAAAAETPL